MEQLVFNDLPVKSESRAVNERFVIPFETKGLPEKTFKMFRIFPDSKIHLDELDIVFCHIWLLIKDCNL